MKGLLVALCLVLGLYAPAVRAHTASFNVLLVRERAPGEFITSWERTQNVADPSAAYELLRPVFPEQCRFAPPLLRCGPQGLSGRIGFDGLGELSTTGIIKLEWLGGKSQSLSLTSAASHVRISGERSHEAGMAAFVSFVRIGVSHIWLGWDHLLFVLGLLWLVPGWRPLLKTITAFTLAHSLTLAAATLHLVLLPSAPVEAVIALSIAFLAVEMVREARTQEPSFTRKNPWLVAFGFGLLHGFGFASALTELKLGSGEVPVALFGFNVGVELGQLAFVLGVSALRPVWRRLTHTWAGHSSVVLRYAIGITAMYWFFERVAAFWPEA